MDSRKLSLCLFSSLICLCSVFFLSAEAAADQLPYSLTLNQTLALYGVTLPGYYYNGASVEEIEFTYVGDTFTLHNDYDGQDGTLSSTSIYDESGFLQPASKMQYIDFLIYKWESPAALAAPGSYDFQIRLTHSIDITATKFEEAVFWSNSSSSYIRRDNSATASHYYVYGSSVDTVLSSRLAFRPSNSDYQNYYGFSKFALNTIDLSGESYDWAAPAMYCQFFGAACSVGSNADDAEAITIGSSALNIKAASPVTYPYYYDPSTGEYSVYSDPAVYLLVACPVVYGEYTLPDSGGSGGDDDPSGDINVNVDVDLSGVEADLDTIIENQESIIDNQETANEYLDGIYTTQTAQLNDIIDKLDDIYSQMELNGDLSVSITNQTNALILGIQNLFIPTQAQLINFRMSLESELHSLFPAAFSSEEDMVSLFQRLSSVEAQSQIWFPGVSVGFEDRGQQTQFEVPGQWVDLKPVNTSRGFQALYEAAALAIDIIATILFLNMLRNKFEGMMRPDGGD